MNYNLINLLSSSNEEDALLGISIMGSEPERYSAEIFSALVKNRVPLLASYCKSVFPFFADPYRSVVMQNGISFKTGEEQLKREKTFLHGIERLLENLRKSNTDPGSYFKMLSSQKVLSSYYIDIIKKYFGEKGARTFQSILEKNNTNAPRQLGYAPTFSCNLSCDYCMSFDKPSISADLTITKKIIAWAAKNDVEKLRLYGGEPTYYTHFSGLIQEAQYYGLKIYLASNMLTDESNYSLLHKDSVECIVVHAKSFPPESQAYQKYCTNMQAARDAGIELILRYNLQDEDWSFLVDLIERFKIKQIAFAPIITTNDELNGDRNYWIKQAHLSWRFVDFMIARGMRPVLSRPIPLCCIEDIKKDVGGDPKWDIFTGTCSLAVNDYTFNFLVWPDGSVLICDADNQPEDKILWNFKDWKSLKEYLAPRVLQWQESALLQECEDCYYKSRALCQGSCLTAKSKRN